MEVRSIQRDNGTKVQRPPAIEVRSLTKRYTEHALPALDAVTLAVPAEEIHGVIGLSGAGKSTLLRCIARLENPSSGRILIEGNDWTSLSAAQLRRHRGRMGIVFQQLHLVSSRTVSANVALPLELHATPRSAVRSRVMELLEWFGIADKARSYPGQLSGGQRQRVALARALAMSPAVLLADEPTSALDPETRASVLNTLLRIREQFNVTILIITHDLHSAATVCDTITVLDAGRVAESAPAKQLLRSPMADMSRRLLAHRASPEAMPVSRHPAHFEEIGLP